MASCTPPLAARRSRLLRSEPAALQESFSSAEPWLSTDCARLRTRAAGSGGRPPPVSVAPAAPAASWRRSWAMATWGAGEVAVSAARGV